MLSVAKLTLGQEAYYEQQVARGLDDYYAGRGESPGIWTGAGAGGLGLVGIVDDGDLGALLRGVNPASGSQLREPVRERTITVRTLDIDSGEWREEEKRLAPVSGYDLVFSSPKSVSLLHALTEDERVRREISEAHERAWQAALGYLEREACVVRRGHGGSEREHGSGFVAAAFRHRKSRAQDPHLHTHVIVANMTRTAEGEWRALDGEAILKTYRLAAGYLYEAQLRHELSMRLGLEWTEPVKGMAELAQAPEQAIRAFSTRRRSLVEHMQEHGTEGFVAARVAALATREAKEQVDLPRLRLEWQARAAEYGLGRRELDGFVSERPLARRELGREQLAARLFAADGLTATRTSFSLPELVCAVAGALPDGAPVGRVLEEAEALSRFPGVELVEPGEIPGRPARFTTRELLEIERDALAVALVGQDAGAPSLEQGRLAEFLMASRSGLGGEQRMLVHEASCRSDRVVCVVGVAGAGKTTALSALADAHRDSGILVLGAAPSGRAADELESATGIPSRTLHGLLLDVRERPLPHGCVLVVDEAGMAETRMLAPLLRLVDEAEGKALLVGDPAQLPAVGAGGLYPALCEQLGAIELAGNRRQRDPLEREALAQLRAGDPEPYLAHAARNGRLSVDDDPLSAKKRLVHDWWQSSGCDRSRTVMLAYRRDDVRDLNQAAHARMLRDGRLGRDAVRLGDREFRVGDRVLCRRNDTRLGVRNGSRGTIVDLDKATLTIRDDAGRRRRLPLTYAAEHLDYGYALTGHAAQGATFQRAFVLVHGQGALREWGYVALTRARIETRLYLAGNTAVEPEIQPRAHERAGPPERAARALERCATQQLALEHASPPDTTARLLARQREQLEWQRDTTTRRLAAAERELKQSGWWKRGSRRALESEIALHRTSLRLADEKRAQLERTRPASPPVRQPYRDGDQLTPIRSLRPESPTRRTLEREPPALGLEL
jgi:conjugative relaxase-like TrwC/TraI family protein